MQPRPRPRCAVSVATDPFDLVIESTAKRVTNDAELDTAAAAYREQGWPAVVDGKTRER